MTQYKAITINPITCTIEASHIDSRNSLAQYYAQIDCHRVDVMELPNGDSVWIDDEGLFVQGQSFFRHPELNCGEPVAGIAIVTGTVWDDDGDRLTDCQSVVDQLLANVTWLVLIQRSAMSACSPE